MKTCDDIRKQLVGYVLNDLPEGETAEIRNHLAECEGCRAAARDIEPTLDLLREALAASSPAVPERLGGAYRRRILEAGMSEQRTARGARHTGPDGSRRAPANSGMEWWLLRSHPRLGLAAAAVLLAAFVWGLVAVLPTTSRRYSGEAAEPTKEDITDYASKTARAPDTWETAASLSRVGDETVSPHDTYDDRNSFGDEGRTGLAKSNNGRVLAPATRSTPGRLEGKDWQNLNVSGLVKGLGTGVVAGKPAETPAPEASKPAPAEFDAVGIVKSPVVMRGIHGSRSPGAYGRKPGKDSDGDGAVDSFGTDIPVEVKLGELPETVGAADGGLVPHSLDMDRDVSWVSAGIGVPGAGGGGSAEGAAKGDKKKMVTKSFTVVPGVEDRISGISTEVGGEVAQRYFTDDEPAAPRKEAPTPAKTREGMEELRVDLPKPAFIGTPQGIRTPNLEPPGVVHYDYAAPKADQPKPMAGADVRDLTETTGAGRRVTVSGAAASARGQGGRGDSKKAQDKQTPANDVSSMNVVGYNADVVPGSKTFNLVQGPMKNSDVTVDEVMKQEALHREAGEEHGRASFHYAEKARKAGDSLPALRMYEEAEKYVGNGPETAEQRRRIQAGKQAARQDLQEQAPQISNNRDYGLSLERAAGGTGDGRGERAEKDFEANRGKTMSRVANAWNPKNYGAVQPKDAGTAGNAAYLWYHETERAGEDSREEEKRLNDITRQEARADARASLNEYVAESDGKESNKAGVAIELSDGLARGGQSERGATPADPFAEAPITPEAGKVVVANTADNLERFETVESALAAEAKPEETKQEPKDEPFRFKAYGVNPFYDTAQRPFSTFAIDVDTASYTLARNYMSRGLLPPAESVRTEEFVNFFDYAYPAPEHETFRVFVEAAPSKFGRGLHMLKIGIKGRRLGREEQRPAMLTFLIDTSGSMDQADRLGLVRKSLKLLVDKLGPNDRVTIIQYDSHARLVLAPTGPSDKTKIVAAIDALQCSGSTNLEEGMARAYALAAANFVPGGENRVLLLSDGVANLGAVAAEDILRKVDSYRRQGITCSVFGFGMGTYDDEMLESLANKGDGNYTFVDSEEEARRVFVEDLSATLKTIASDVKIQVEFNPKRVARYRQLGYENRQLKDEQFRDDTVDAGEVGSGQSVTALYELEPANADAAKTGGKSDNLGTVRVRYRRIDTGEVEEIEHPIKASAVARAFRDASARFRLAACVAEFAEILRGSPFAAGSDYADVATELNPVALDLNLDKHVQELLRLVSVAGSMGRGE